MVILHVLEKDGKLEISQNESVWAKAIEKIKENAKNSKYFFIIIEVWWDSKIGEN